MARSGIVGLRFAAAAFLLAAATIPAAAQDISVSFGQGNGLTERVLQLVALVTVLSLARSILVMVKSRACPTRSAAGGFASRSFTLGSPATGVGPADAALAGKFGFVLKKTGHH